LKKTGTCPVFIGVLANYILLIYLCAVLIIPVKEGMDE